MCSAKSFAPSIIFEHSKVRNRLVLGKCKLKLLESICTLLCKAVLEPSIHFERLKTREQCRRARHEPLDRGRRFGDSGGRCSAIDFAVGTIRVSLENLDLSPFAASLRHE